MTEEKKKRINYTHPSLLGRPLQYSETFGDEIADEFMQWWNEHPECFWFYEYFDEVRHLTRDQVDRLKKRSSKLRNAVKQAFKMQEGRIYRGAMNKAFSERMSVFGLQCKHKWAPPEQKVKVSADDNAKTLLDKVSGKSANLVTND